MGPILLCVGMDPGRLMRVSLTAMSLGIAVKDVKKPQWGQTVGALCGLDHMKETPPKATVEGEMMVMAFFSDWLLDDFFAALRKNGIEPARLKAVLTPVNRAWTCGQLYAALRSEDAAMRKG